MYLQNVSGGYDAIQWSFYRISIFFFTVKTWTNLRPPKLCRPTSFIVSNLFYLFRFLSREIFKFKMNSLISNIIVFWIQQLILEFQIRYKNSPLICTKDFVLSCLPKIYNILYKNYLFITNHIINNTYNTDSVEYIESKTILTYLIEKKN